MTEKVELQNCPCQRRTKEGQLGSRFGIDGRGRGAERARGRGGVEEGACVGVEGAMGKAEDVEENEPGVISE